MTDGPGSLVNIGQLAEPFSKLVDAVRSATGVLYEPRRIRREAKAEADAEIIRAKGRIELADVEIRAEDRVRYIEARRQRNIDSILEKAEEELPNEVSPEPIAEDWMASFIESSKDVSNDDMQRLWAKILAGELAKPSTFAPRTLALVKLLRPTDAEMFQSLCAFLITSADGSGRYALVIDSEDEIYLSRNVTFDALLHLEALGLITFAPIGGYQMTFGSPVALMYANKLWVFDSTATPRAMSLGRVMLTSTGHELSRLASAPPVEGFIDYLNRKWEKEPGSIRAATAMEALQVARVVLEDAQRQSSANSDSGQTEG